MEHSSKKQRLTTTSSSTLQPPRPPPPPVKPEEEVEDSESSDEDEPPPVKRKEEEEEDSESSDEDEESDIEAQKEKKERKDITLILTDPDVLKCPVCFDVLKIPVYQCTNGHIACGTCYLRINNKCSACCRWISHIRCWAIEKVLEALQISCENIEYGCKYMMKYGGDRAHESLCIYSPCSCPMVDCNFVDSSSNLYEHIHTNHSTIVFYFGCRLTLFLDTSKTRIFLREKTVGIVFVLNIEIDVNDLSVVLIAPKSHTGKYRYELKAKDVDEEISLTLKSPVKSVSKLADDYNHTRYLFLNSVKQPSGKLDLDVWIRQHGC